MARLKVLQELTRALAAVLESALAPDTGQEAGVRVHLAHPQDLERAGVDVLPLAVLYLMDLVPDPRVRSSRAALESLDRDPSKTLLTEQVYRPPLWVVCRYVFSVRARHILEQQELFAAALQALHDHPLISLEELPSLGGIPWLVGAADSFPVSIVHQPELWRILGLSSHRLLISFEITVPLPSGRRAEATRILERQLHIEEFEEPGKASLDLHPGSQVDVDGYGEEGRS